jgi:hypothetical protein
LVNENTPFELGGGENKDEVLVGKICGRLNPLSGAWLLIFSNSATDLAYCLVGELGADVDVDNAQSSAVLMLEGNENERLGF